MSACVLNCLRICANFTNTQTKKKHKKLKKTHKHMSTTKPNKQKQENKNKKCETITQYKKCAFIKGEPSMTKWIVIGCSIGGVIIIGIVVWWCCRRKRRLREVNENFTRLHDNEQNDAGNTTLQ